MSFLGMMAIPGVLGPGQLDPQHTEYSRKSQMRALMSKSTLTSQNMLLRSEKEMGKS